ncbi:MAG: adenosine kinase [Actinobacteria bacterium]|nr:adenosine kinase [Actinomycetota bacterium]
MVKGSMQLIDDVVAHELYADMASAVEISGGSAANTAAGFASLGGDIAFIGKVSDDQLGEVFAHDIRAAGVRFQPPAAPDAPTGRCLIIVSPDAERTLNTFLGASSLITPDDIDELLVEQARVLYCEGYLWDQADAKAAILKAMRAAGAAGRKVAFTLSDSFCVDRHRDEFRDLAENHVDILFANEPEICSLYEVDTFDEAAKHVSGHCELAALTRGAAGCVVITSDGERVEVPAFPVDQVVDTTGAGDLFASGFLYGLTHGRDLENCARLAGLAAAEVISHVGARPEVSLAGLAASNGLA